MGGVLLLWPAVSFAARMIVGISKVTLVGSWRTEGRVYSAPYYYENVFWSAVPMFLLGIVLIVLGRLLGAPADNSSG